MSLLLEFFQSIVDSYKYCSHLNDLGKLWVFIYSFHKDRNSFLYKHINTINVLNEQHLCIYLLNFHFQGHLREGYGKLIENYCRLLIQKLRFHKKVRDNKIRILETCHMLMNKAAAILLHGK